MNSDKKKKARGRPRNFDEDVAIRKATEVFWAKGYDAASLDDLVEAMGVQRRSIYRIFGDKVTIFDRCLKAYMSGYQDLEAEALLEPQHVLSAIRTLLRIRVQQATGENTPKGCLFVCVAPVVDNCDVRSYLAKVANQLTAMLTKRLEAGVKSGELPKDFPCESRARAAMDLSRGLVVRARIGASRDELLKDADEQAALILSH